MGSLTHKVILIGYLVGALTTATWGFFARQRTTDNRLTGAAVSSVFGALWLALLPVLCVRYATEWCRALLDKPQYRKLAIECRELDLRHLHDSKRILRLLGTSRGESHTTNGSLAEKELTEAVIAWSASSRDQPPFQSLENMFRAHDKFYARDATLLKPQTFNINEPKPHSENGSHELLSERFDRSLWAPEGWQVPNGMRLLQRVLLDE